MKVCSSTCAMSSIMTMSGQKYFKTCDVILCETVVFFGLYFVRAVLNGLKKNSIFDKLYRLSLFLLEFCMLRQHVFGCNQKQIWPNSFDLDFSVPFSKFHTFLHLKAYGCELSCMEKIYMSCYVLICLSNILSNFWSLSSNSWVSHIIDLNAFLDRDGCKRTKY